MGVGSSVVHSSLAGTEKNRHGLFHDGFDRITRFHSAL